jgi:hypothetical protein
VVTELPEGVGFTAVAPARQVVLVGAGLDGRAYRLRWRAGSVLFELDSPSVLAFKHAVAARAGRAWAARVGREIPRFLDERRGGGRCWLVAARA